MMTQEITNEKGKCHSIVIRKSTLRFIYKMYYYMYAQPTVKYIHVSRQVR